MLKLFSPLVFRILLFVMTWLVIILACMVYNPLSPKEYFNEMNRLETVQVVIEQSLVKKPIKQKNLKVKKSIKKIEYVKPKEEVITLPVVLPDAWWEEIGILVLDEPVVVNDFDSMDIQQQIDTIANEVWYDNVALAKRIIKCESWFHVYAKNRTSSAKWLAQFLTWDGLKANWKYHKSTWTSSSERYLWYKWDVFNTREHLLVFFHKLKNEWTNAWNASSKCRAR